MPIFKAERIDTLQDEEAEGNPDDVAGLAQELGAESSRLGFGPMAESAAQLVETCGTRDPEALHKAVVDVTEIAKRVRQGHRGAA